MFELFKKEIRIGDSVKLLLISGNEAMGKVLEIGSNYVLIESKDNTTVRYFEKLIGGWEMWKLTADNSQKPKKPATESYSQNPHEGIAGNQRIQRLNEEVHELARNERYEEAVEK